MTRAISQQEFEREVISSSFLSLVQFKTEWSGACQILAPLYEELANTYDKEVNFFTVDMESEKSIGDNYGIMELPTILFFRGGSIIDHVTGLTPGNVLVGKIESALNHVSK